MPSTLQSASVTSVLARLRAEGEQRDPPAKERVRAREAELGRTVSGQERADLYSDASLAISPQVGELLYVLVAARRAHAVVEFGSSLGFSTIHLASALRDNGTGSLITTEFQPAKARIARQNLADAGLEDLVELREGDALETLKRLDGQVDLLFLDGWNDLYLPVLLLVEPQLVPGSLVVADLSKDDPQLTSYCNHVHDPDNDYLSIDLPLDAGVVLSARTA